MANAFVSDAIKKVKTFVLIGELSSKSGLVYVFTFSLILLGKAWTNDFYYQLCYLIWIG